MDKFDLVRFTDNDFELDVRADSSNETVWLTQEEMALLFDVDRTRIVRHIYNIYLEKELDRESTCAESAQVQKEGSRSVKRFIKLYNLDMIISVGYRVKSQRGILFRRWANKVLKEYLIQGYSVNERKLTSLGKTIQIQNKMLASSMQIDFQELSSVINEYTQALNLLDDYDHQNLSKPKGSKTTHILTYEEARKIIDSMKFNLSSSIFGVEKEEGKLEGILVAVHQHVFGQEVYPSLEAKAAHLLYFLVKDHPFYDGCKRIAATLFLEFLNKNNALVRNGHLVVSNDALATITLLTAESSPDEMETIVTVIENILAKNINN